MAWRGSIMRGLRGLGDEQGVALPLALLALLALSGLLVAFLSVSALEPAAAGNLHEMTRARYLAEAGIEWAFDRLIPADPACWSAVPNCWSALLGATGGTLATGMSLPGLPPTFGAFSVTVRNDTLATDPSLTGQGLDPGGPTTDTNNVLIVTSIGTSNGVTRQIQAVVSRADLPLAGGSTCPASGRTRRFPGTRSRSPAWTPTPTARRGPAPPAGASASPTPRRRAGSRRASPSSRRTTSPAGRSRRAPGPATTRSPPTPAWRRTRSGNSPRP